MIRQDWMVIVGGAAVIDTMSIEQKARCTWTGRGYDSGQLCRLQREQAARGILGAEIVCSMYGHSVRYDSGLQGFGLLARSKDIGGTLEDAIAWCKVWIAEDSEKRYAWYRK